VNSKLLRSLMVLHGDTNASLAAYLGITENSVSNKINENGTEFKQREISKIMRRYDLSAEQVREIFFA
jgi:plasmid maintenance system antidote protein VapI